MLILSLNQNCIENCSDPFKNISRFQDFRAIYMGIARKILISPGWVPKGQGPSQVVTLTGGEYLCIPLLPTGPKLQEMVNKCYLLLGRKWQSMSQVAHLKDLVQRPLLS